MEKPRLTLDETKAMLLHVSAKMIESKDLLTKADQAIGDGDHGIGMARGFEAVQQKLSAQSFATMDELFRTTGTALLMSVGGAAGAIFGTLFRGGAKDLASLHEFDAKALSLFLTDGLQAVKDRGKAKLGDKTMVDALEPAALKSAELTTGPLDHALAAVAEAARLGMEKTKEIVAATGKAKTLGERSLGHPDPGAVSTWLILKFMREYVMQT
jgi:dihydroxyacetone kinase-like protein